MANSALGLDLGDGCVPARFRCGDRQGQEAASPLNFATSLRLVSIMPPASPEVDEWYYVGTQVSRSGVDAATRVSGRSTAVFRTLSNARFNGLSYARELPSRQIVSETSAVPEARNPPIREAEL